MCIHIYTYIYIHIYTYIYICIYVLRQTSSIFSAKEPYIPGKRAVYSRGTGAGGRPLVPCHRAYIYIYIALYSQQKSLTFSAKEPYIPGKRAVCSRPKTR